MCAPSVALASRKEEKMKTETAEVLSEYDGIPLSVLVTEPETKPKGIIQISHGMCENKERYLPLMEFLADHGFVSVIHDHRGHGKSVRDPEDLGYFYDSKGEGIVKDLHQITLWSKAKYPHIPLVLLGHSMGTLVARNYLKRYDQELDKLILTGPPSRNPAVDLGLLLARIQKKFRGGKYRSREIQAMAFGPYAAKFGKEGSRSAWVCSDPQVVEEYDASPLCGFLFTADGFESLFCLLKGAYSKKGWQLKNPSLPVLFLGGREDPCIGGGRKFVKQLQFLKSVGYESVTGKMYPEMRHEILNERKKRQVFENILTYLEK